MKKIFTQVANIHNTTAEEVEKEISLAIELARKNPSPTAVAFWEKVDENMSAEDIINLIAAEVIKSGAKYKI